MKLIFLTWLPSGNEENAVVFLYVTNSRGAWPVLRVALTGGTMAAPMLQLLIYRQPKPHFLLSLGHCLTTR